MFEPTFLVVDDEEALCELIAEEICILGGRADFAVGGAEALRKISQDIGKYSVVITDYMMPGMFGTELAAQINALEGNSPRVVLMTGLNEFDRELIDSLGIVEVLEKPIDLARLEKLIETIRSMTA